MLQLEAIGAMLRAAILRPLGEICFRPSTVLRFGWSFNERALLGSSEPQGLATGLRGFVLFGRGSVVEFLPVLFGEESDLVSALGAVGVVDAHQVGDIHVTRGAIFVVVVKIDGLQGASGQWGRGGWDCSAEAQGLGHRF